METLGLTHQTGEAEAQAAGLLIAGEAVILPHYLSTSEKTVPVLVQPQEYNNMPNNILQSPLVPVLIAGLLILTTHQLLRTWDNKTYNKPPSDVPPHLLAQRLKDFVHIDSPTNKL